MIKRVIAYILLGCMQASCLHSYFLLTVNNDLLQAWRSQGYIPLGIVQKFNEKKFYMQKQRTPIGYWTREAAAQKPYERTMALPNNPKYAFVYTREDIEQRNNKLGTEKINVFISDSDLGNWNPAQQQLYRLPWGTKYTILNSSSNCEIL
ncbi:hypothetical protein M1466_02615 [Candidatus Dependentiae bacterium]|nr:hypothetical protein [Candidatus Dependentiae bacterium]